MNESIITDKSYEFARNIICLYKKLTAENLAEMYISTEETDETEYWIKLLTETEYINIEEGKNLLKDY